MGMESPDNRRKADDSYRDRSGRSPFVARRKAGFLLPGDPLDRDRQLAQEAMYMTLLTSTPLRVYGIAVVDSILRFWARL
jgi:hypothetical protein